MLITNAITKRWSRDEYYRLWDSGFFGPEDRVELIEGEIVLMTPPGYEHTNSIRRGNMVLAGLYGETHDVAVQCPLDLGQLSEPQPDFALIDRGTAPENALPNSADLVIEVAKDLARNSFPVSSAEAPGWQGACDAVYTDVNKEQATQPAGMDPCSKSGSYFGPDPRSSLAFDRKEKAALYAKAGIPEYWIVDLTARKLEVHRDPGPVPEKPGTFAYVSCQLFAPDQSVQPLRVPGPPCPLSRFFDSSPPT